MQAKAGPMTHMAVTAQESAALFQNIQADYLAEEAPLVQRLAGIAGFAPEASEHVIARAAGWVREVRAARNEQSLLDAFMRQYDLSTEEGVVLMCLAEALLRIPDEATAEKLISDKLGESDWHRHLGQSDSILVNAGTWGLMLSGQLIRLSGSGDRNVYAALQRMIGKSTEPVIKMAVRHAMKMMGTQFVLGRTIVEAMQQSIGPRHRPYLHSFDMLGEAALTAEDAERYLVAYQNAITEIANSPAEGSVFMRPSVSIKLSALHPRYEFAKSERVLRELTPKLALLAMAARRGNIGLTIDAEEADRLELSLRLFEQVFTSRAMQGWEGFGLVVQGFQKRAPAVIEWLAALAAREGKKIPVRLVKGAYWDTEIKRSQEQGLDGFPVYTRKVHTDVAYLACARRLLEAREQFYPMFATHNANTVSSVLEYAAGSFSGFEFQRLHGMGEALYAAVRDGLDVPCRVYAPVGSHEDLLPYLVRRLLENGANTSFVNRIYDESLPAEALVADPVAALNQQEPAPSSITESRGMFLPERLNSAGINFSSSVDMAKLQKNMREAQASKLEQAIVSTAVEHAVEVTVTSPSNRRVVLGQWRPTSPASIAAVIDAAQAYQPSWARMPLASRCDILEKAADLLEQRRDALIQLLAAEAGKTLNDGVAEVREAVDFCRYYAATARKQLQPVALPGPTGEHNELQYHAKGVFVCISPWNFPLAIFMGQIAAALVTGNVVVAKPAEQTNLIAAAAVRILHEAGIPVGALQLVLGDETVGKALTSHAKPAGVVFTGSVGAARSINRALAMRDGPIATLIAETGGQNAMIVDSSALPEQVVKDAINSAFYSAGQRCSALRVLYVQSDIADKVIHLLQGAMRELAIGDPSNPATDIGPIIDAEAVQRLQGHRDELAGQIKYQCELPQACAHGSYFAPCLAEISSIAQLKEEFFGPFLHVIRYQASELPQVIEQINATGYGLTLGIHSRINQSWQRIQESVHAGNCYVNRGMTGAVVGVQPFGGEGLSGTGPKAGGPNYLMRFVSERTLTINTAAVGGNAQLLNQGGRGR